MIVDNDSQILLNSDNNMKIVLEEGGSNCLEYVDILKVFLDYREEREAKLDRRFIVRKNIVYLLSIQISRFIICTSLLLFSSHCLLHTISL